MAAKTRRKELEAVRTYRSEEVPLSAPQGAFWTRLLPWSRARARNRYAARLREAFGRIEAPDLPDVKVPDINVPEVRLPNVKLPDLKLQDRISDVQARIAEAQERISDIRVPDMTTQDVRDATKWPRRAWQQRRRARQAARWTGRGIGVGTIALAALAGAAAAYFFDPERGRGRRIQTADRVGAFARRRGDQATRVARYVSATASAKAHYWMRPRSEYVAPNDAALKAKVESELLGDPTIDKGRININVENGVVVLRGTADSEDQIQRIVTMTRSIDGVRKVRDVLRVPSQATTGVMASPESSPNGWTATESGEMTGGMGADQSA